MKTYNFTSLVGYEKRTNNKIKKRLGFLFISAFILYLLLTGGIAEIIICAISAFAMFLVFLLNNITNNPTKMLTNLTDKKGSQYFFDILPIKFEFNKEDTNNVNIIIEKAEYFNNKIWNKSFSFKPENIGKVNYFEEDGNLIIEYTSGTLTYIPENNTDKKTEVLGRNYISLYLEKDKEEELINEFEGCGFLVNKVKGNIKEKDAEEKEITEENKEENKENV